MNIGCNEVMYDNHMKILTRRVQSMFTHLIMQEQKEVENE